MKTLKDVLLLLWLIIKIIWIGIYISIHLVLFAGAWVAFKLVCSAIGG